MFGWWKKLNFLNMVVNRFLYLFHFKMMVNRLCFVKMLHLKFQKLLNSHQYLKYSQRLPSLSQVLSNFEGHFDHHQQHWYYHLKFDYLNQKFHLNLKINHFNPNFDSASPLALSLLPTILFHYSIK